MVDIPIHTASVLPNSLHFLAVLILRLALRESQLLEVHIRRVEDGRLGSRPGPLLAAEIGELLRLDAFAFGNVELSVNVATELGLGQTRRLEVGIDLSTNLVARIINFYLIRLFSRQVDVADIGNRGKARFGGRARARTGRSNGSLFRFELLALLHVGHLQALELPLLEPSPGGVVGSTARALIRTRLREEGVEVVVAEPDGLAEFDFLHDAGIEQLVDLAANLVASGCNRLVPKVGIFVTQVLLISSDIFVESSFGLALPA